MCQKEGTSLQKGMNFRLKGKHSVILLSVRKNSPYQDEIKEDGTVLIYEGHDVARTNGISDQKKYLITHETQPSSKPAPGTAEFSRL